MAVCIQSVTTETGSNAVDPLVDREQGTEASVYFDIHTVKVKSFGPGSEGLTLLTKQQGCHHSSFFTLNH